MLFQICAVKFTKLLRAYNSKSNIIYKKIVAPTNLYTVSNSFNHDDQKIVRMSCLKNSPAEYFKRRHLSHKPLFIIKKRLQ